MKNRIIFIFIAVILILFSLRLCIKVNPAPKEMRGIWIASMLNIDFPNSETDSTQSQKTQIKDILDNVKKAGLNTVFFQVRPTADSLYNSDIFPWSKCLTGKQGKAPDPYYDPLKFMISEGKKRGIAIHAWINPFRITDGDEQNPKTDVNSLCDSHPAKQNKEVTVPYADGKLYFNPGNPQARELIIKGIVEIIKKYDIKGIHLDDYFYPSAKIIKDGKTVIAPFNDTKEYKKYGKGKSLEDFRRDATYTFIKETNEAIKTENQNVVFGVSPFGVWASKETRKEGSKTYGGYESYRDQFADTRKWVKSEIIDYICPQLYWSVGNKPADFQILNDWWSNVCKGTKVKYYIGHALYKLNEPDFGTADEIIKQLNLAKKKDNYNGSVFFGYSKLKTNDQGIMDALSKFYTGKNSNKYISRELTIAYPDFHIKGNYDNIFITGSGKPQHKITLNGKEISTTKSGYFTVYVPLKNGENSFIFNQNGKTKEVKATKTEIPPDYNNKNISIIDYPGKKINISVIAPANSQVFMLLDGSKIKMNPKGNKSGFVTYSTKYILPHKKEKGLYFLGKPKFRIDNKYIQSDTKISVYNIDPELSATVKVDEAPVRLGPSASFDRGTPLKRGITDNVVFQRGDYYKLTSGVYISKEYVTLSKQTPLINKVKTVSINKIANNTEFAFAMPKMAPYELEVGSEVIIKLKNTTGKKPPNLNPRNPVAKNIKFYQQDKDAVYRISLKNFNGIAVSCKDGKLCFMLRHKPENTLKGKTIVLDAGHGGKDKGARSPLGGPDEKDFNLLFVNQLKSRLEAKGARVILTRESDKYVPLIDRSFKIMQTLPDLSVSIHHDSKNFWTDVTKAFGPAVLYSYDFSKPLAETISDELAKIPGIKSRGTTEQSLQVCRIFECPAVLIELGYITNAYEFEKLVDPNETDQKLSAILNGIEEYFKK